LPDTAADLTLVSDPIAKFFNLPVGDRLRAIIEGPEFPDWLRDDVIKFSEPRHPVFGWSCIVPACERNVAGFTLCNTHRLEWAEARKNGMAEADWLKSAEPFTLRFGAMARGDVASCAVGCERDAINGGYCKTHAGSIRAARKRAEQDGLQFVEEAWRSEQQPLSPKGPCLVENCGGRQHGGSPVCFSCYQRFQSDRRKDPSIVIESWAKTQRTWNEPGWIDLSSLPLQFADEMRYTIYCHSTDPHPARWPANWLRRSIFKVAEHINSSVTELSTAEAKEALDSDEKRLVSMAANYLRPILIGRDESRAVGYLDVAHWGVTLKGGTVFDLTNIRQKWLRELTWDWMASRMDSPKRRPSSAVTFTVARTGIAILSDFLAEHRPDRGEDPSALTEADARAYDADWNRRVTRGMTSRVTGKKATRHNCYANSRAARQVLRDMVENPRGDDTGVSREFVYTLQIRDNPESHAPKPLPDAVYDALVDPDNLLLLADLDASDLGIADAWLVQAAQGRRITEVLTLGLDSIGIIGGQPRLWHDMHKVGVVDYSIPLAKYAYEALLRRQAKTLARFEQRNHRPPTDEERAEMVMFPSNQANPWLTKAVSYATFSQYFRDWLERLDLKGYTSHQARHTLATELLNSGATPQMVQQFLGQVSERALNAYARYSDAKLNPHLANVWVRGPGGEKPGEVLLLPEEVTTGDSLAHRTLIELTVIPTEGGLCTFKPVVGGDACPKNRRCDVCEDLVLTGADYSYWKRQESKFIDWAESAQTPEARDAFYKVWQPMGDALFGLEKALTALGLLEAAQQIDLRSPAQDFHHPIWSRGWSSTTLREIAEEPTPGPTEEATP
jgi:integrase